ncbi:unnamed protein product [Caenorhabditis bovis]|uniref:Uncharacterized protein n=1 Tax=Caenorhabditis bovis TaxID=2654633 RepID=A0A8S1ETJ1_9PELO|nr:unnamed protein product [Caenorhabditis bovis]
MSDMGVASFDHSVDAKPGQWRVLRPEIQRWATVSFSDFALTSDYVAKYVLGPYEEPVVCPDGVHPLFINPACHRGETGYFECPENIENCTCVLGWPCPSITPNSLLVNFGRPFVDQIECDPLLPICKRAVNGKMRMMKRTVEPKGRWCCTDKPRTG